MVRGTVTGDVSGAAGTIHIAEGGRVGGSISGAAGDVRIGGEVGGDVTAGSGNIQVTETATIGGDVSVGAGYVRIDGRIDGDVRVGAETIVLGPNADIGGEFRYDAAAFTQDPAATVAGGVVEDPNLRDNVGSFTLPNWVAAGTASSQISCSGRSCSSSFRPSRRGSRGVCLTSRRKLAALDCYHSSAARFSWR